ncbi:MAG: preprotein translocase subunit SecA [Bacteroidia bacterium]|nr:preprotein translocase subunit SecA [Bacteroidia bacterium]MCC6769169.1 preprotein translocase subunit SecA [Bacteroidia bacterium]
MFGKLLGSKSERDLKEINPLIEQINKIYPTLQSLSHDELRAKTLAFKAQIAAAIEGERAEMADHQANIDGHPEMDFLEKEQIYESIDKLKKKVQEKIETVLLEILPDAFAVIRETARRFKENETISVTATDLDREFAVSRAHVSIDGTQAIYRNSWEAAGNTVTWDMVHYDVQLIGGIMLHKGKISEMATGEGKTLVATLPVYLNALSGEGVHLVTVNDYLARRDSEWMGPLYEFHGLRVDCIDKHEPNSVARRKAYLADITFGTNNEFGFDYLRDNMSRSPEDLVQRRHNYAIVDEVDSVLIDDARTPLIISGPTPRGENQEFFAMKPRIEKLVTAQKNYINTILADAKKLFGQNEKEAGMALLRAHRGLPKNKALIKFLSEPGVRILLQKTENFYMQDQSKDMPKVDQELFFVIDEKNNTIELTEKGIELITGVSEDPDFFVLPDVGSGIAVIEKEPVDAQEKVRKKDELLRDFAVKSERIHTINQLLKAYTLFEMDVEYVVMDGKVKIVDEQTGRILDGRRYSDGLHQAIEAKENVKIEAATQTYATVTLQNYFRMYSKLAGMTGTAETEAGEFWDIYKLDVAVIPTNRAISRKDKEDLVYKTKREKYNAVIEVIVEETGKGRPVLVGTTSVEISELLSRMLKLKNIRHNVLNAKFHQREAEIVAEAGQSGTVTIATNMAGRGTDIKLGPGVKDAGGLAIIGTERHESRRVDRQLRGRAGRQGDPGSSQFFVSLEDDLMRLFGSERIAKIMDRLGMKDGEVIQSGMITNSIERAQRKVEENNFGIRKRLLEYDDVMNSQREVVYKRRRNALYGERLEVDIANMMMEAAEAIVQEFQEQRDFEGFKLEVIRIFSVDTAIAEEDFLKKKPDDLADDLYREAADYYNRKSAQIAKNVLPVIKDVFDNQSDKYENIVIPLTDGIKGMQVLINLRKGVESGGREVISSLEKSITLMHIDEAWKEHLRDMDELKQSVQNAVYEQKDPLLIYKLESFNLFKQMLGRVGKEITSFLMKANLPAPNVQEGTVQAKPASVPPVRPQQNITTSRSEAPLPNTQAPQKPQPAKAAPRVGRNDPCPCGSGKKFKNCHGVEVLQ